MKEKYLNILKKIYPKLTAKDEKIFEELIRDDGLGDCKPRFNLWGFLFGWFYLLYRRAYLEAVAVLLISLMVGYFYLPGMVVINSILGGFCYYFLYLNKFSTDVDRCGGVHLPDIECLKQKAKPNIWAVIFAVFMILLLIWPVVYAIVTGQHLR
ncbi:MAG: DUF2628 domain-containing protein [Nautiliaceae bacterium]